MATNKKDQVKEVSKAREVLKKETEKLITLLSVSEENQFNKIHSLLNSLEDIERLEKILDTVEERILAEEKKEIPK